MRPMPSFGLLHGVAALEHAVLVKSSSRKVLNMGNLAAYKRIWGKHHDEVRRIYKTWQAETEKWDRYKGSEAGDEHIQAANDAYTAAVAAERDRYWQEMWPVLQDMRTKVENIDNVVTLPDDDQLKLLQTVSLLGKDQMDYADYSRYLDMCRSSSVARKTLWSLAKDRVKGGENLQEPHGEDVGADRNYKALFENARSLARWDGTSRRDAMDSFLQEKQDGVPMVARQTDTAAAYAGDVDPTSSTFIHDVIGIVYDESTVHYLD